MLRRVSNAFELLAVPSLWKTGCSFEALNFILGFSCILLDRSLVVFSQDHDIPMTEGIRVIQISREANIGAD